LTAKSSLNRKGKEFSWGPYLLDNENTSKLLTERTSYGKEVD